MDVLATCHANSVLLAIALAASSSACDGSTSANPPRAASGPTEPGSSAEPEARIDADIARFVARDAVARVQKRGDRDDGGRQAVLPRPLGRTSCRGRVGPSVLLTEGAGTIQKK